MATRTAVNYTVSEGLLLWVEGGGITCLYSSAWLVLHGEHTVDLGGYSINSGFWKDLKRLYVTSFTVQIQVINSFQRC